MFVSIWRQRIAWKYWHYLYLLTVSDLICNIDVIVVNFRIWNHIPARHIVRDTDGCGYIMNVGVTDLDPKPLSCIEKHRKRDCEVLTACLELLRPQAGSEGESVC